MRIKGLQLPSARLGLSMARGVWHHRRIISQQRGHGLSQLKPSSLRGVMRAMCRNAALLTLLIGALSCAGSVRPVEQGDMMAGVLASETGYLVREEVLVPGPFGRSYLLRPGQYGPTHVDSHGMFYAAPTGVVERNGPAERTLTGGIHSPNQGGRYYSYPSLYVDLGDGSFSKLPFPEEVLRVYGTAIVFTHNGQPVH